MAGGGLSHIQGGSPSVFNPVLDHMTYDAVNDRIVVDLPLETTELFLRTAENLLYITETDQADPAGQWRFRAQGDVLYLEGAATASWATDVDIMTFTRAGAIVFGGTIGVLDDVLFNLGTTLDGALVLNSAGLAANTALTGVIIGTPVTPALAAKSLIIANITADGDILIAGNDGGHSRTAMFFDSSAAMLHLYATTLNGTVALNGQTFDAGAVSAQFITTGALEGLVIRGSAAQHGSRLILQWDDTTPVTSGNVGQILFKGYDGAVTPVLQPWATIGVIPTDVGDGTETGRLSVYLMNAGVVDNLAFTLSGAGALWLDSTLQVGGGTAILGTGEGGVVLASDGTLRPPNLISGAGDDAVAAADLYIQSGLGRGPGDVGQIIFQTSVVAAADTVQTYATALTLDGTTTMPAGAMVFTSANDTFITKNTTDGADNTGIAIGGGGALSDSRGAYIYVYGNEHSASPGQVWITGGGGGVIHSKTPHQFTTNVGFFATTPVAQQTGCAVPTDLNSSIAAITALRTALINYGLTTTV